MRATAPRSATYAADDRSIAVLDATTFAADIFDDRDRNQRMRERFRFATTDLVRKEVQNYEWHLPDFVTVHAVDPSQRRYVESLREGDAGLSPADRSLDLLSEVLREQGADAVVVSEDDRLREFTEVGWETGHLLVEALGEEECWDVLWYVPSEPAPDFDDSEEGRQ